MPPCTYRPDDRDARPAAPPALRTVRGRCDISRTRSCTGHAPDMHAQGTMRLCPTRRPTCDCNVQGAMLCLVMCIVHSTPRMHLPESSRKHLAPPWCLEPCAQHGAQSHPIPPKLVSPRPGPSARRRCAAASGRWLRISAGRWHLGVSAAGRDGGLG